MQGGGLHQVSEWRHGVLRCVPRADGCELALEAYPSRLLLQPPCPARRRVWRIYGWMENVEVYAHSPRTLREGNGSAT